jgi:nicotinamide mononucleotide (NMN) deamidase PncC
MAVGALLSTPQADIAAAVTGFLGPGAPPSQDGLVFLAFAQRRAVDSPRVAVKKLELAREPGDRSSKKLQKRLRRQRSAAVHLLDWVRTHLRIMNRK